MARDADAEVSDVDGVSPSGGQGDGGLDAVGSSRRDLIKKGAIGAAVAWTAPTVLSSPALAGPGTDPPVIPPAFVAGSADSEYVGAISGSRSITLTSGNVTAGDLWIAIASYSTDGSLNYPTGTGWFASGPISSGTGIYSVESVVIWRVLTAGDISGGSFSQQITTSSNDITFGGLRGAAVAYSGSNLAATVTSAQGTGSNSGDNRTSQFPAATGAPLSGNNAIVRLGSARGYGGWFAFSNNIDWTAWPGTARVDYNADNEGDRALIISEQVDNPGNQANGTWYRQFIGANNNTTFTAAITAS
jgi:hypothetical protein